MLDEAVRMKRGKAHRARPGWGVYCGLYGYAWVASNRAERVDIADVPPHRRCRRCWAETDFPAADTPPTPERAGRGRGDE